MSAASATPRPAFWWGKTPVPYTVTWTGENEVFLGHCPIAKGAALCSPERPGEGKPLFGSPHPNRQRRAIALQLCELCGRPLKNSTLVSLSQARPRANAANVGDILQVEAELEAALSEIEALRTERDSLRAQLREATEWRPMETAPRSSSGSKYAPTLLGWGPNGVDIVWWSEALPYSSDEYGTDEGWTGLVGPNCTGR